MPTGRQIKLKGFKIGREGKPIRDKSKQPVSARLAEKHKPKVKYLRGTR